MSHRVLPVGDDALLVEVGSGAAAEALHAELLRRRAAGLLAVREIVPAARTVLLDGLTDPARLAAELTAADVPPAPPGDPDVVEIPVRYDGPDLAEVAAHWGVREHDVARIHAETEFRVAFCGFAPGFGYLTGLPRRYDVPRRATPRTAVPAGAVALAGPYTGVYPRSSPGGWQLIGTTEAVLWDHARVPAALLSPGTRVRFVTEVPEAAV
jgi:KipI family sensor histidine kinase inhibitor